MGNPREPWGKTDDGRSHHLAHHCADVAAVLEALLLTPAVQDRLQSAGAVPRDGLAADLARWAYLHDVGKLAPGFQAKGWEPGLWAGHKVSHLDAGHQWFADRRRLPISAWLHGQPDWCAALFAHHGRPVARGVPAPPWPTLPHYDWQAGEAQLLDGLERWFPGPAAPLPVEPRVVHFLAGLLALADWIGSDRTWFDFVGPFDPGYGALARERAALALRQVGLAGEGRPPSPPGFPDLTGHPAPNAAQAAVAAVPAGEPLVILEAETGSGKTEAALWRFARLWAEGQVDGLYFALPTRAAAAQIRGRVTAALARWLGVAAPEALLAVPGQLRSDDHQGYRLPGFEVRWDDGGRRWAAEHATRFLAARVAVGTVDQAMMAALQVRHAPMRAAALSRSLLVVDEVHASDAYMRPIVRRLVEDHVALGGHALLMSATLGAVARAEWLRRPRPSRAEAEGLPYPAVWTRAGGEGVAAGGRDREVAVAPVPTMAPEAAAAEAVAAAREGARVLVIRNTVAAAVATWEAARAAAPGLLLQVAGGPALHHARFAAEDRARLDAAVEAALGKDAAPAPAVVIGTQTLEQALDIDADLLITDLCPMDVLLQRIGRLHRHDRLRPPGFGTPRALVLMPERGLGRLAAPNFENGLGAWGDKSTFKGIYTGLPGLEAVRRAVGQGAAWRIPAMNRALVEAATHPEALAPIVEELGWQAYDDKVLALQVAMKIHAAYLIYRKDRSFWDGMDAFAPLKDDAKVRTRLGGEGVVLELPKGTLGPFGEPITRFALPAHQSQGLTGEEPVEIMVEGDGLALAVSSRRFGYDRRGLRCLTP